MSSVRKPSQRDVLAAYDRVVDAVREAQAYARTAGPREIVEWIEGKVIDARCDRTELGVFYGERDLLK